MRAAAPLAATFAAALLLAACQGVADEEVGLAGSHWRLAELQPGGGGAPLRPDDPAKYEMQFGADGKAAFRLDCNRAAGGWTQAGGAGRLSFTPLAMTRAACLPGSLDTRIARELGEVDSFQVTGDSLRLGLTSGGAQVWTRIGE